VTIFVGKSIALILANLKDFYIGGPLKLILSVLICMSPALTFASNCGEVLNEFEAMRKAQNAIMNSLANNHEAFAGTIEELTMNLELRSAKVPQQAIKSMNQTAQAFRQRGVQAKKQALKLDDATAELSDKIKNCLKK
jgi:hypothetical protein